MLFLNDGEEHLQPMEPEEADHLHMCAKEPAEARKQSEGDDVDWIEVSCSFVIQQTECCLTLEKGRILCC